MVLISKKKRHRVKNTTTLIIGGTRATDPFFENLKSQKSIQNFFQEGLATIKTISLS